MSTLTASERLVIDTHESNEHGVAAAAPVSLKVLASVVIATILTSLIGLVLTAPSGDSLTSSAAVVGFGVLGTVGTALAVLMGFVALTRDN